MTTASVNPEHNPDNVKIWNETFIVKEYSAFTPVKPEFNPNSVKWL